MYKHLTSEQRYTFSILLQNNIGKKQIATELGVHISTLYRELKRNTAPLGRYHWDSAQANADYKRKGKPSNRCIKDDIVALVKEKLTQEQWSPKQISGRFAKQGVNVSHETIGYAKIRSKDALYTPTVDIG